MGWLIGDNMRQKKASFKSRIICTYFSGVRDSGRCRDQESWDGWYPPFCLPFWDPSQFYSSWCLVLGPGAGIVPRGMAGVRIPAFVDCHWFSNLPQPPPPVWFPGSQGTIKAILGSST